MRTEDFENILQKQPEELMEWLMETITVPVPDIVVSTEDMQLASESLLKLAGYYSYLLSLQSYAKLKVRVAKRTLTKEEAEDMIDKKEIITNFAEGVKQTYSAISRAVTINIENNNELKMQCH